MDESNVERMTPVELARAFAELGQVEDALNAYSVALKREETIPEERLEAACAVLQYGEDYKPAYDAFLALYAEGTVRADALELLTEAFYAPNVEQMRTTYEKNCRLLQKYPYLFRKDFLPFEELPIRFYPYDDRGVIPFFPAQERFGAYTDWNEPVVSHYFFQNLEQPVLAHDIVSQYELEYLRDMVRLSEWVAKENHVYLHYSDWGEFCAHLQHWDLKTLLKEKKFVYLIEDEVAQYPIDFKERFGIDYSTYTVKPLGIREIQKIIWHTQLYAHNGGDFFNEILHEHPNLLSGDSILLDMLLDATQNLLKLAKIAKGRSVSLNGDSLEDIVLNELVALKNPTLKDAIVAISLGSHVFTSKRVDPAERIVPALFFQPHFEMMKFEWSVHESGALQYTSSALDELYATHLLDDFKYIKTFTPMRRPTTSHGATIRFMQVQVDVGKTVNWKDSDRIPIVGEVLSGRLQNRSYMAAKGNRLFDDGCIVRFEDAKLNPAATFHALAGFLDLPYTESMTYCSGPGGRNPDGRGFSTAAVYRTYDEFMDEYEGRLIEYVLRDAYELYGYDFHYYDGKPMTHEEEEKLFGKCNRNLELLENSWWVGRERIGKRLSIPKDKLDESIIVHVAKETMKHREYTLLYLRVLQRGLPFCDELGRRLRPMPLLKPIPELMENPTYH